MQPRENRTIALLDGFQQTRPSVSQGRGCLRSVAHWTTSPHPASCAQPEGPEYPAQLLEALSDAYLVSEQSCNKPSPPPKGSPATFNFARFQTSKTSYLETHTVLDAAGSSIPGCGDPRASFRRHHLVAIVFSILCSSIASILISPPPSSTLLYLPPPATPSTSFNISNS